MNIEQLQFVFSLFSLIGVIGILFYILLKKSKIEEHNDKIEELEREVASLKDYIYAYEQRLDKELEPESAKEKIIALYEQGVDIIQIENMLNVPKAKIEMVVKFHNLNKADNWRESV
ncbi:MAG: Unknown protein [uncultured Sulfurovum sp.]|uniref:Uncharacterized protein n=1 Tax=uncultured Sulfurovum sp. TaxID=269237 RepID=A0A6S6TKU0_9BACT|nr:MAG: Unknown protein [uncultured Sulfurovum sp.]